MSNNISFSFPAHRTDIAEAVAKLLLGLSESETMPPMPDPIEAHFKSVGVAHNPINRKNLEFVMSEATKTLGSQVGYDSIKCFVNEGNLSNPSLMLSKVLAKLGKSVGQQAADAVSAGDPNMGTAAGSGDGSHTSTQAPNSTTSTETESTSSGAQPLFDAYWKPAGTNPYEGYEVDPELNVPVNDKGFPVIDTYGVPFDKDWCGQGAMPFMKSGKRKGQWKKRVGVNEDAFNEWYDQALAGTAPSEGGQTEEPAQTQGSAAAGAFGAGQQQAANTDTPAPTADLGSLMAWLGEKQAAQVLTNEVIQQAYVDCSVTISDLAQPGNLQQRQDVYAYLSNMPGVGA